MKCFSCGKNIDEEAVICPFCKKEQGISREIFDAAKAKNQQACADIFNLCYGNVYYTVKSMIKEEDVIQQVVVETFVQAFRSMDWMDYTEGKFQAWIQRIAHDSTVSYIRKNKPVLFSKTKKDNEDYSSDFWDERQEQLPDVVISRDETTGLIQEILDTLSEEQRLAVGMYYYEEKSVQGIAQTMGVSENVIRSRLSFARKKIQDKVSELEKEGTDLYGLAPIPFLLFLFRNQGIQTTEAPNVHTLDLIRQELSTDSSTATVTGDVNAESEEINAAAMEQSAENFEEEEEETVTQKSSIRSGNFGYKILAGVGVIIIAVGVIVYSVSGRNTDKKTAVQLSAESETESELPTETESESETVSNPASETESEMVEEFIEPNAMIVDVPDWEAEDQTVLGNSNLLRSEVSSITFLSSAEELTGYAEDMAWDVSEASDGSVMAYALEDVDSDYYALYIVSESGVYANANCSYMFAYYSSVTTVTFNGLFNTSRVTDMSGLFSDDDSLEQVDLTGFDTSNVTDMNSMFCECISLQEVDVSLWNTASVTDMSYMFQDCSSLASLDLTGFNTMGVEYMTMMFEGCNALGTLDLSSFQTAGVLDMSYMFEGCYALVTLDVSSFDTANVTDMSYMFEGCEVLESLDLSSFDTSEVISMSAMFEACAALTTLDISNFDTGNVENMEYMFSGCVSLTSLDVSSFNTSNVGNMNGMFSGCESLTTLDVNNFDTSNVGDMSEMFYNCTSLSIDLSSFDMTNVYNMENMTEGCLSVTGL